MNKGHIKWTVVIGLPVMLAVLLALTTDAEYPVKLSDYKLFQGIMSDLQPSAGVIPYDLNTPLFSDYALKKRFVKIPAGEKAVYEDSLVFGFPVGTILVKNFYYPADFRYPNKDIRLIETRLLIKKKDRWIALPYIWNKEQSEAFLEVAGGKTAVAWKDVQGKKHKINYLIPNMNQCKGCHERNGDFSPIGPAARHLNKSYDYGDGMQNQLNYWKSKGMLANLPATLESVQKNAVFDDPASGTIPQRARAWLDINCGHCHNPVGPANTSGLFLDIFETDPTALGVNKPPIAAGLAAGKRHYDIVPGKPRESILMYRITSDDPGIKMPEIGRTIPHTEGVALIREWIKQME